MTDLRVRVGGRGRSQIMAPTNGIIGTLNAWELVSVPANISLDSANIQSAFYYAGYTPGGVSDAFGSIGVTEDPYNTGRVYKCYDRQGLWRSDLYGNDSSWYQINDGKQTVALDGTMGSIKFGPSYLIIANLYASVLGVVRSTDAGSSFTRVYAGSADPNSTSDIACVAVCKADPTRVMGTAHGPVTTPSPNWIWSKGSGASGTWIEIPDQGQGLAHNGTWLDASTFISQGPSGVWQGVVDGSDNWTFTKVIDAESNHGGTQMWLDSTHSRFYVGIALPGPGRQQVFYSTLANRGAFGSWVLDSDVLGGGAYGCSTLIGTSKTLFGQGNYATHAPYGPVAQHKTLASGGWTADDLATPYPWYTQGAMAFAAMTDGIYNVVLASLDNVGTSRYVELA